MKMNIRLGLALLLYCQLMVQCSMASTGSSPLASQASSQAPVDKSLLSATGCPNSNVLIKILESQGTKLSSTPQINHQACGLEWSVFGTCCEYESLVQTVTNDKEAIKSSVMQFQQINNKLHDLFKDFAQVVKDISSQNSTLKDKLSAKSRNSSLLHWALSQNTETSNWISTYESQSSACWDKMISVRAGSVCSACSGRSQIFFQDNAPKIDPAACSAVMDVCEPWFASVQQIARHVEVVKSLVDEISKALTTVKRFDTIELRTANRIKNLLINNEQSSTKSRSSSLSASYSWLCTKFLRLQGLTAIDEVNRYLDKFSNSLSCRMQELKPTDLKYNCLRPRVTSEVDPFADINILKQSDNMFDSYVGAQGSTIFCPNASGQPLNLAMTFP